MSARRRLLRLLTLGGIVRVRVCPLCCALVLADGAEQHDRAHVATYRSGGQR